MQKLKETADQLPNMVARGLLKEMEEGKYRDADKLPSEVKIAEEIGLSRTAVRDGLSIMEREGWITRIWGHGTVINRHVFAIKNRIDLEREFLDMVRMCGYDPKIGDVRILYDKASAFISEKLKLEEGESVIRVGRTILASGTPAIYCEDIFSENLIRNPDFDEDELKRPIFEFIDEYCNESVFMELTEIHATDAKGPIAEALSVKEGTAVLNLHEVGYNQDGVPILYSDEYYVDGIISHSVIRKKI